MRRRLQWIRDLRERVSPRPVVLEREDGPNGAVITTRYADYRSPTGATFSTVSHWPDGTVASRRWTQHENDARSAHQGEVVRHARRPLPEEPR